MRIERSIAVVGIGVSAFLSAGCDGFGRLAAWNDPLGPNAKVTIRFVAPPHQFAMAPGQRHVRLTASNTDLATSNVQEETDKGAFRAALWGGKFKGEDVTYNATELQSGPYMFGLFDPDRGGAYQGWISVNSAGDDVLGAMEDWKQSIQKQQNWLAYEAKASGKFQSHDADDFTSFEKNLGELRRLEKRIARAINRERLDRKHRGIQQSKTLADAEVLIVPGGESFMRPWTRPTFSQEELSTVRAGTALTKFVLVGDYETATGKLHRVAELRDDLDRNRSVFNEEFRRLEHRRRFYLMTDHLYHHGSEFVENEKRLQQARGMISKLDRQIEDYNQKFEAILFVTGLFAPDEALAQFEAKSDALDRDRAVVEARVNQIESQINDVSERSEYRVRLEQKRQDAQADRQRIDDRMTQIGRAQNAVRALRDSTAVIHRHGPASVIAATMVDLSVPPQFAMAIERESLLTIRLQAADGPRSLDSVSNTTRTTSASPFDWNKVFQKMD